MIGGIFLICPLVGDYDPAFQSVDFISRASWCEKHMLIISSNSP